MAVVPLSFEHAQALPVVVACMMGWHLAQASPDHASNANGTIFHAVNLGKVHIWANISRALLEWQQLLVQMQMLSGTGA